MKLMIFISGIVGIRSFFYYQTWYDSSSNHTLTGWLNVSDINYIDLKSFEAVIEEFNIFSLGKEKLFL